MKSTHMGELNISGLSFEARKVYLFENLHGSLLGFGPLCDDGCLIQLDCNSAKIFKKNELIMSGTRDGPGKLWLMNLPQSQPLINELNQCEAVIKTNGTIGTTVTANNIFNDTDDCDSVPPGFTDISHGECHSLTQQNCNPVTAECTQQFFSPVTVECTRQIFSKNHQSNNVNIMPNTISTSIEKVIRFYHGAFGSMPISTFRNAIHKKFISFPGINVEHINKHLKHSHHIDRGHMKRIRQGLNSTKPDEFYDCEDEMYTRVNIKKKRKCKVLISMMPATHRLHFDATGRIQYSDSNSNYDLIFYSEDANYIHAESMTGLTKFDYVTAITDGINFFTNKNITTEITRLDNQTSDLVVHLLAVTNKLTIEAVPPDSHRGLKAERAIQTWKNNKISVLATADDMCPGGAFKNVNAHCEMILNLVRESGISPHMSAWQQVHGAWSYTDNPIAPFGMKVEVFRSKSQRATTWDYHSEPGYYVGLPHSHHRCHKVFLPRTRSVVISDTLSWYPKDFFLLPGNSSNDDLLASITHLQQAIHNSISVNTQPNKSVIANIVEGLDTFKFLFTSKSKGEMVQDPNEISPPADSAVVAAQSHTYNLRSNTTAAVSSTNFISPPAGSADVAAQSCPVTTAAVSSINNISTVPVINKNFIILNHKGKFGSTAKPLNFLIKIQNSKSKSYWESYTNIKLFPQTIQYIESKSHLWKIYQDNLKFIDVDNEPEPWYKTKHQINPISNSIDKIFQHRHNNDFINDYDIQIQNKGQSDKIWIRLKGTSDSITKESAFLRYLFKSKDKKFSKYFATSSFESKFHFANMVSNTTNSDHHGLKYLDKGKALRYFKALKGDERKLWILAHEDELDRLIIRKKQMRFIRQSEKEKGRKESYWNPQLTKKLKNDVITHRIRGCVGGDVNDFTGNTTAYTASLPTVKLLFNGVISEKDAKIMTLDIKDFFLHGSSGRNEYMRIPLSYFTENDMIKYDIKSFIKDSDKSVLVEIHGNMYGLVNAAIVAQEGLVKLLNENNFYETNTPQLYKHQTLNIQFTLVVDDFAVKYTNKEDAELLIKVLEKQYDVSADWEGKLYLGMTIDINRTDSNPQNHTLTLSMNGYIQRMLERLNLGPYKSNVNSPMVYSAPIYGQKVQYIDTDDSDIIDADKIHLIKQGVGGFLYYCRAVGYDFYTTVSKLSSRQANPTEKIWKEFLHLLNYANTWPDSYLVFKASDMVLILDGDVSYLSESNSRSRGGGIAFCGRKNDPEFINGAIDVLSIILPTVVASTCEGEYATSFVMAQLGMPLRVNLRDMGYPQDRTIITTDNKCAEGIANKTMKLKRSRSMDMRYHWLQDRVKQGDYAVKWRKGTKSLADFFTKTLPTKEFLARRALYVVKGLPILLPNLQSTIR